MRDDFTVGVVGKPEKKDFFKNGVFQKRGVKPRTRPIAESIKDNNSMPRI